MPFEPLQFLHAANLRLDSAMGETVRLAPPVEAILSDASLVAFDRIVATALERRVDFLLLAGNVFVEAEHSLAARLALLDGFRRLAAEAIRVLVLPGGLDPVDAWERIPDLPANVTLLDPDHKSAIVVKRDDTVVARLRTRINPGPRNPDRQRSRSSERELRSESQRPVPFTIGVAITGADGEDQNLLDVWTKPRERETEVADELAARSAVPSETVPDLLVDYFALGGASRRTIGWRRGIAHDPGPTQGKDQGETGPCGCSLVTVESDGTVRCDFVPTASVRWERFSVRADSGTDRSEIVRRCRELLQDVRWESNEEAWILEWVLRGKAAAIEPFEDEAARRQFQQELNEDAHLPNAETVVHILQTQVEPDGLDCLTHGDPLQADFAAALAEMRPRAGRLFQDWFAELQSVEQEWSASLAALLPDLDAASISSQAQRALKRLAPQATAERALP